MLGLILWLCLHDPEQLFRGMLHAAQVRLPGYPTNSCHAAFIRLP